MDMSPFVYGHFTHGLELGPNSIQNQAKILIWIQTVILLILHNLFLFYPMITCSNP